MRYAPLDTVVLNHDIPEHGLRAGDLGAVVEVYADDALEVEFLRPSGDTQSLVILKSADVRPVAKTEFRVEPLQVAALLVERDLDRLDDHEVVEAVTSAARKHA